MCPKGKSKQVLKSHHFLDKDRYKEISQNRFDNN